MVVGDRKKLSSENYPLVSKRLDSTKIYWVTDCCEDLFEAIKTKKKECSIFRLKFESTSLIYSRQAAVARAIHGNFF